MSERQHIPFAFVAILCAFPAIAQAPEPSPLGPPVALCDDKQCTMTKADFDRLRQFHASRLEVMEVAATMIDGLQEQVNILQRQLRRLGGSCREHTTT